MMRRVLGMASSAARPHKPDNEEHRVRKKSVARWLAALTVAALALWYLLCLPRDLFEGTEYSTVVVDRNGELLGARIAADGQWRFPQVPEADFGEDSHRRTRANDSQPYSRALTSPQTDGRQKYLTAVIEFEDRWFRWHPGVNPVSIVRAFVSNVRSGHIVSGGSTITMQVIRMSRRKERSMTQKLVEAIMATRLELRCSKDEILRLYSANAPFGGNVVGIDAAAWRYFGRPASELSWGEAAMLAVMPNSPSSIRLEKNRERLMEKRNRLLTKMRDRGILTSEEYWLACSEPLPSEPKPLPSIASQLVDDIAGNQFRDGKFFTVLKAVNGRPVEDTGVKTAGKYVLSSIDINLQRKTEEVLRRRSGELAREGIGDMAAVIEDVATGEILAYCGNADPARTRQGAKVNAARAPRSSGSILKPFLYCDALEDGIILPHSLLADTPVNINGFSPQNYDLTYEGAVPAAEALSRSLNIPAVHLLKDYGVARFRENLMRRGLTTLTRSASDYGLSLILGGGECRLDEVTAAYARMASEYMSAEKSDDDKVALYYTFDALKEVNRPDEMDWHIIRSVRKVAWKTGTSYGYRDAWAVGTTPSYAVGVWAGNASGAGAPGILGARTAGPVMLEIFDLLPSGSPEWFPEPTVTEGVRMEVCRESGSLAGAYCADRDTVLLPKAASGSRTCPYHLMERGKMTFRLPPAMEWFYRQRHPEYESMQPDSDGASASPMEFIYPENGSKVTLPRQMDDSPGEMVLNLAHHDKDATVYWHLDRTYIGETRFIHQMRIRPEPGRHSITVVDEAGNQLSVRIYVTE